MNKKVKHTFQLLRIAFPHAFHTLSKDVRPLRLGILDEIATRLPDLDSSDISRSLKWYTRRLIYHAAVLRTSYRIDLLGNKVATIDHNSQLHSCRCIKTLIDTSLASIHQHEPSLPLSRKMLTRVNYVIAATRCLNRFASRERKRWHRAEALHIRTLAFEAANTLATLVPIDKTRGHAAYLNYWLAITRGQAELVIGNFAEAKEALHLAEVIASQLNTDRIFPNYFQNVEELQLHRTIIDAIAAFAASNFLAAYSHLKYWCESRNTTNTSALRFDSYRFLALLCKTLGHIRTISSSNGSWLDLDSLVQSGAYLGRPIWALLQKVSVIRAISVSLAVDDPNRESVIRSELATIASCWRFLNIDVELAGVERGGSILGPVEIPTFLDVFERLRTDPYRWQMVLQDNLRHMLLMKAEYEFLRFHWQHSLKKRREYAHIGTAARLETLDTTDLVPEINRYVWKRPKAFIYYNRAVHHLRPFRHAIANNDMLAAIAAQKQFLSVLRGLPHVIRPRIVHGLNRGKGYRVIAQRLWRHEPEMSFTTPVPLRVSYHYYLRSSWSKRRLTEMDLLGGPIFPAQLPQYLSVFHRYASNRGPVPSRKFLNWFSQIDTQFKLIACRLLGRLRFYSPERVRALWLNLYQNELPPEVKDDHCAFVPLGHFGKSGSMQGYFVRQAIGSVEPATKTADYEGRFRSLSELDKTDRTAKQVVFVDDLIGSGSQGGALLKEAFERYEWLNYCTVYYCALVGFESGIAHLKTVMGQRIKEVFVGDRLSESHRAFSKQNYSWGDTTLRVAAEEWATSIGRQALEGRLADPSRHALGWDNSQALIAFYYNTPNNTLPLFWGTGIVNGRPWMPLLDRFD
jgi:hypothetical protein